MTKIETLKDKSGESIYPLTSTKAVVDENGNTIEHRLVVADGEDLVTDGNVLRLKDRPNTDGMGYVILRKDKTFQEQVTKPNTIYEIRYDFDMGRQEKTVVLDTPFVLPSTGGAYYRTGDHIDVEAGMTVDLPSGGVLFDSTLSALIPTPYTPSSKKSLYVGKLQSEAALGQSCVYSLHKDVVIPENCVLKFEGGSLGKGTVILQNTFMDTAGQSYEACMACRVKGVYAVGQYRFDKALNKPIWWNGTEWVEGDNQAAGIKRAGTWSQRPNADGSYLENGFQYFLLESTQDTDPEGHPMESLTGNGKPIWWIQSSRKWVDAFGNTITGSLGITKVNEVRHLINGEEYKVLTTDAEGKNMTIYAPIEAGNGSNYILQSNNDGGAPVWADKADLGL